MEKEKLLYNNIKLLKEYGYDEEFSNNDLLEIEKNKQGFDNLRYETEVGEKIYLHSQYDLEKEWKILTDDKNLEEENAVYIVYGLGMGHHIKKLKESISSRSYILVIEKNKDIITTYMNTQDFNDIVGRNIYFLFGSDEEIITKFKKYMLSVQAMVLLGNIKNIILPSYYKIYGSWLNTIQDKILDVIRFLFFSIGNDMEDTIIGMKNNLDNFKILIESPSLGLFKDTYKNVPLIIVSAGPSLDKNIHQLKNVHGKALIIATDAVLSTLRQHDILPDGVVSIERIKLTYEKFYKDKNIDSRIVFIGPPVVAPEIFESLKDNKKLIILREEEKINEWINNDILKEDRLLQIGSSCAHIAFSFAKLIGADPIIFVGQDLAYTKEGITHSQNVEVRKHVEINNANDIVYVKGIDGELLPTSQAYKHFLTWFELEIAKEPDLCEYIDATEGGAYIEGTKIMSLKNVVDKYCNKNITSLYKNVPERKFIQEKYDSAITEIEKLIMYFKDIEKEASLHIQRLKKLEDDFVSGNKKLSNKDIQKIFKVLGQVNKIEDLALIHGVARILFQAVIINAGRQTNLLGNSYNDEKIIENISIQKNMVASIIVGCYSVLNLLEETVINMKIELEDYKKDEG